MFTSFEKCFKFFRTGCRVQGLGDVEASGETVAVVGILASRLKKVTVVEPHSCEQGFTAAEMKWKIDR